MATSNRIERMFAKTEDDFVSGLSGRGKKNANHAKEIRNEIELTRKAMAAFLERKLPLVSTEDDWKRTCVREALVQFQANHETVSLPEHDDLSYYDIRSLSIILQYNLDSLSFERGESMSSREIRRIIFIRNDYEHLDSRLNHRLWKNDIEAIRVFRSKMQTDRDIETESYTIDKLPQMEKEARIYADELDAIQREIQALVEGMTGLGGQVKIHAKNDIEQFDELERQRGRDAAHDSHIKENTADIEWLTKRDRIQRGWIIGLIGISGASLLVALASLLKR